MKKFFWTVLFLFFLAASFWVLFFSYFTQIKHLDFSGEIENKEEIRLVFNDFLKEKVWKTFPRKNFFFFSKKAFKERLKEKFPLVESVQLEKSFPEKIILSLEKRQGVFIWCFGEDCFWVDRKGELFFGPQPISEAERSDYALVLGQEDKNRRRGEVFFPKELVEFVLEIRTYLKQSALSSDRFFSSPNIASEELRVGFKEGWQAYFSLEKPFLFQVKILEEVLEEKLKEIPREKIEYIDLRLSGKALFKLRDDSATTSPTP